MYPQVKKFPSGIDRRIVTLMDNCFISPSVGLWFFPTNSENQKSLSNYCFTKLKWFNQDAFVDSPTCHFRSHFCSWSCGCGQWTLKSHWYQLSRSCRQACAQRKWQKRELAEFCCSQELFNYLKWGRKQPNRPMLSLLLKGSQMDHLLQGNVHR